MNAATCDGFWTGCGFQQLVDIFGLQAAGVIVVAVALLYIVDDMTGWRTRRKSNFDSQSNSKLPLELIETNAFTTDLEYLKGNMGGVAGDRMSDERAGVKRAL